VARGAAAAGGGLFPESGSAAIRGAVHIAASKKMPASFETVSNRNAKRGRDKFVHRFLPSQRIINALCFQGVFKFTPVGK
jgi:hypothetical protein